MLNLMYIRNCVSFYRDLNMARMADYSNPIPNVLPLNCQSQLPRSIQPPICHDIKRLERNPHLPFSTHPKPIKGAWAIDTVTIITHIVDN
jgi:hypothetical protein